MTELSLLFGMALLSYASPVLAQTSTTDVRQPPGIVAGTIVDDTGTGIAGAKVTLLPDDGSPRLDVLSRENGQFSFSSVPPGPFRLTVSSAGFADQNITGVLPAGESSTLPPIRLTLDVGAVTVDVILTTVEIAQHEIEVQEQQRVLGILPNFYVSYNPNAAPLTPKQKFELSWKTHLDPIQFAVVAAIAGIQQGRGDFAGFGDGAEGYAKRYAAAYATIWTRSVIAQVLLPSLLKQDPRYFYKGTGSTASRTAYAVSRTVVRKGDNGHWQPNYSGIIGTFAAGAISNLYYPEEDRHGLRLTFVNAGIGLAGGAVGHLAQEFLFDKLTTRAQ